MNRRVAYVFHRINRQVRKCNRGKMHSTTNSAVCPPNVVVRLVEMTISLSFSGRRSRAKPVLCKRILVRNTKGKRITVDTETLNCVFSESQLLGTDLSCTRASCTNRQTDMVNVPGLRGGKMTIAI